MLAMQETILKVSISLFFTFHNILGKAFDAVLNTPTDLLLIAY